MLKQLYIRNYAIIQELNVDFESGLTILTGETGAGKSIILGALSLIMGERADTQSLRDTSQKCIIEARFAIHQHDNLQNLLLSFDFDTYSELIIRREISALGKSRIFVNDTPASLIQLQQLSDYLIDMHRQFDTVELQSSSKQLQVIDDVASTQSLLSEYQSSWNSWKHLGKQLDEIKQNNIRLKQELDYHQFLFDELHQLQLQEDELEHIEKELALLQNSEALKSALSFSTHLLLHDENPAIQSIKQSIQRIAPYTSLLPTLEDIHTRLQSSFIEIKEIANELEYLNDEINLDQEKIEKLTERLNEGNRLLQKHHVHTTAELLSILSDLEKKLSDAEHADEQESALQQQFNELHQRLVAMAQTLSEKRKKSIQSAEQHINHLLPKVGMPNARLRIDHQERPLHYEGIDKIDFLLDANKTNKFLPLMKAASGGELSRLMLCIKSLQASGKSLPTLIFDEIDTGISGETALQVGTLMKSLATHHQLIAITHLPQIAGKAHHHLYIYKQAGPDGELQTHINKLSNEKRIDILAEMLGGKENKQAAHNTVIALLNS